MTTDTPRPNAAARSFMLKAFSRPLMDQGFTAQAATQILMKRYPWLAEPAPVALAKAQTPPPLPSAWEKIQQIAKMMVEKGEAPTLPQAIDKAVQALPHLFTESESQRKGHTL
jgi:hypothetical protein